MSADLRSPRPRPASASGRSRLYASTAGGVALAPASDAAAAASSADTAARQVSHKPTWRSHGPVSGLGTGGIVGLVVGLVIVVLVGVVMTHCLRTHWRSQRRKRRNAAHAAYAHDRKDLLPLRVRASVRSSFASPRRPSQQRLSCDTLNTFSSPTLSTRDRFSQPEIKTASTVPSAWLYSAAAPIGNMSVRSLALSSPRGTCHIIDHQRQKGSTSTTASSSRTHSSFATTTTGDSSLTALSPPRPTHVRRGTLPYNSIVDSADGLPSPTRTLVDYSSSDAKVVSPRHAVPPAVASPTSRLRAAETYASPQRSPLSLCHDTLAGAELEPPSSTATSYLMTRQASAAESALSLPRTVSRAGSIYDVSEHDADVPQDEGAPSRAIGVLLLDLGTESNHAAFGPTPPPTPPRLLSRKNAQGSRRATELPATPPSSSGTPSPPAAAASRLQTPRIVMTGAADALAPAASQLSAAAREQQEFKDAFMLDLGAGAQPLPLSLMPSPMVERANPFSYPTEASPPRPDGQALATANRFKVRGGWL